MENRMIKILAIDDNQDNLVTLKALVTDIFPDARMLMATSGARGLEIAASEKPDVILLDVIMPGMDGFEVCRKLKADKELHDIPVVFVTAIKGDKESRIRALESGAEAFLSKPIDETELTAQIRAMLKINSANLDKRNEKERLSALVEERTRELQEKNILTINLLEDLRTEVEARKKTELELRISEEIFSKSFYTSPDSIIINRLDNGKIVEANDGFRKMIGYEENEVIGKTTLEINLYVNPEERNIILHELKTNGQIKDFECWFAKKNGLPIMGLLSAVIIDINGIKHILSTTRDITERKRVEEALQKSETEFRQLAEAMPQIVWITRPDGWNIFFNQQWVKYTGQTLEESYGHGWNKPFHPDDQQRAWDAWQNATANLATYSLECRLRRFDGEYKWWLIRGIPVLDEHGDVAKWYGTCTDINERKQAEALLSESEKRNRGILANLDAGIVIHAPDTSIILSNPKAAELLGMSELQMQGKLAVDPGWHFIDEYNKPLPLSEYPVNQIKSHKSILKQFIIGVCRPVTGDVIWLMVNGFPVLDKNGEISEILISFIDLTDRKQAADLLQKSEEKYRAIFENVQDVFYQTDLAGTILEISPSVYNLCEYKREELIGCKASLLYNKPDERGLLVNAILLNGELWDYELELKTKSGEIKIVSINARLIKDSEGKPTHIDGAIRDITERKQAEEEARNIGLHYQAIIEKAPDGIVLINAEGNFKFVSPAAKKMFGYQLSEEPVGNPAQFTHPDDVQQVVKELNLIIQDPLYTTTLQYRYKDKNGNWRWVESTFSNLLADPNVEAIVINFRDINDRKLAEEKLKESEEFSRYLLQTIPFGMNIVDEKGNILFQSDNLKELCGEQATGNKCWEHYRDDKKQCVDCPLNEGIKVGTTDVAGRQNI